MEMRTLSAHKIRARLCSITFIMLCSATARIVVQRVALLSFFSMFSFHPVLRHTSIPLANCPATHAASFDTATPLPAQYSPCAERIACTGYFLLTLVLLGHHYYH